MHFLFTMTVARWLESMSFIVEEWGGLVQCLVSICLSLKNKAKIKSYIEGIVRLEIK